MYEDEDSDFLDLGGDSDVDRAESSEDELDILLLASPEERQRLQRYRQKPKPQKEQEDDFEREMNEEVQQTVAAIEAERKLLSRDNGASQEAAFHCSTTEVGSQEPSEPTKFYDNIYFDSDEEDNEGVSDAKKKHPIPTDDDLLYDPNMDDEDERWVVKQRQKCHPKGHKDERQGNKKKNTSRSDAVLNCPACMTTLCRDCQRHDIYDNQFRAMFVTSCVVDFEELLKFPEQKGRRKRKKKQEKSTPSDMNSANEDKYNPVKCEECNTVVAMYDREEVYHFFNVLVSYA